MELNCALKLRWKKGLAVGGNYVSVGGHQGGKTAKNGLGNAAGSTSGGTSGHSVNHSHNTAALVNVGGGWLGWLTNDSEPNRNHACAMQDRSSGGVSVDHSHTFSVGTSAQVISGDNETRPTNRGVKYIIKA